MAVLDVYGNKLSEEFYQVKNYKIPATAFGHDFENRILGDNLWIPYSKFPCKSFRNASITAIAPNFKTGVVIGAFAQIRGERINGVISTLDFGDRRYWMIRFDINIDSDDIPQDSSGYWKIYVPFNNGNNTNNHWDNDNVWFVADIPQEDITEKFILDSGRVESVSADFKKALSIAGIGDGTSVNVSSLRGKVWIAFGDSYTRYLAGLGDPDSAKKLGSTDSYWGKLATQLGTTMYTYGIVGSTIRDGINTNATEFWKPMSSRVDTIIANHADEADDVGLITFMGGTNDGWKDEKCGTIYSTSNGTIAGGCHTIFNKLSNAFPKAKIVVILQPVCGNGTNPGSDVDGRDTSGMDNMQYSILACQKKQRVVKEIAEFYGCTICDCCFDWFTSANPQHLAMVWDNSDHLHLTAYGNQKLTEKLAKTINENFV